MEHFYQNIVGWFNYQQLYEMMVKLLPQEAHIVEIGVWRGPCTAFLAVEIINSGKNIKYDVVDTWKGSDDPGFNNYKQDLQENDNVCDLFKKNIAPVLHMVNPIQLPSVEASKLYSDKSLDFVFIDANHNYDCIKADIEHWLPKIKTGGWIAGHDYSHPGLPDVARVVNSFFGNKVILIPGTFDPNNPKNQLVDFNTSSWLVRVE